MLSDLVTEEKRRKTQLKLDQSLLAERLVTIHERQFASRLSASAIWAARVRVTSKEFGIGLAIELQPDGAARPSCSAI
jgi:hypothetical protein